MKIAEGLQCKGEPVGCEVLVRVLEVVLAGAIARHVGWASLGCPDGAEEGLWGLDAVGGGDCVEGD